MEEKVYPFLFACHGHGSHRGQTVAHVVVSIPQGNHSHGSGHGQPVVWAVAMTMALHDRGNIHGQTVECLVDLVLPSEWPIAVVDYMGRPWSSLVVQDLCSK